MLRYSKDIKSLFCYNKIWMEAPKLNDFKIEKKIAISENIRTKIKLSLLLSIWWMDWIFFILVDYKWNLFTSWIYIWLLYYMATFENVKNWQAFVKIVLHLWLLYLKVERCFIVLTTYFVILVGFKFLSFL